jgi:hypothetical protein
VLAQFFAVRKSRPESSDLMTIWINKNLH